ncbi:winged helix-turn-helix domain-containing protein [Vibrio europaeus]|uniref:winged helix-turn-helix domain-containing protein n=1 Tax=Vibrio europaeus TaxID=300876 RepID=UPI0018A7D0FB|nr:winged helix-turn-helix domain-containing protein [Vibrio europaeus]MDC5808133.1 winged helix-turn-helix domain-containing protein [Vibrio europaeus]QPG38158.1 winged helix-turn-helix domain-containing protein [Vibrio europaeus]
MWEFRPQNESQLRDRETGQEKRLTHSECQMLKLLIANADRVVSKEEIHRFVWKEKFVSDTSITNTIASLRKALDDNVEEQRIIRTAPKLGYFMVGNMITLVDELPNVADPKSEQILSADSFRNWQVGVCVFLLVVNLALFWFLFVPPKQAQAIDVLKLTTENNAFFVEYNDPHTQQLMDALAGQALPKNVDFYISSNGTRIYVSCVRREAKTTERKSVNFSIDIERPIEIIRDEVLQECQ